MAWHYIAKLFFSPLSTIKSVFVERKNNILLKAGERCFMSNCFSKSSSWIAITVPFVCLC